MKAIKIFECDDNGNIIDKAAYKKWYNDIAKENKRRHYMNLVYYGKVKK